MVDDDKALADLAKRVFDLARNGEDATLDVYLEHGFPINVANENGDSLLMLSVYHGHYGTSWMLLQKGADPKIKNDKGQFPLVCCAFKGYHQLCDLLCENGADPNASMPNGQTALIIAAMFNHVDTIKSLVNHGANLLQKDHQNHMALDMALKIGASDSVLLLKTLQQDSYIHGTHNF